MRVCVLCVGKPGYDDTDANTVLGACAKILGPEIKLAYAGDSGDRLDAGIEFMRVASDSKYRIVPWFNRHASEKLGDRILIVPPNLIADDTLKQMLGRRDSRVFAKSRGGGRNTIDADIVLYNAAACTEVYAAVNRYSYRLGHQTQSAGYVGESGIIEHILGPGLPVFNATPHVKKTESTTANGACDPYTAVKINGKIVSPHKRYDGKIVVVVDAEKPDMRWVDSVIAQKEKPDAVATAHASDIDKLEAAGIKALPYSDSLLEEYGIAMHMPGSVALDVTAVSALRASIGGVDIVNFAFAETLNGIRRETVYDACNVMGPIYAIKTDANPEAPLSYAGIGFMCAESDTELKLNLGPGQTALEIGKTGRIIINNCELEDRMLVYTATFSGADQYDSLCEVDPDAFGGIFIAFLDIDTYGLRSGWHCFPQIFSDSEGRLRARHHKLMSHVVFPNAKRAMWIDASIKPVRKISERPEADVMLSPHYRHNCSYAEADNCLKSKHVLRHCDSETILKQIGRYRRAGLPPGNGCGETGILLRRHTPETIAFNELWWEELSRNSLRDQIALGYCLWKTGIDFKLFPRYIHKNSGYSKLGHRPQIYTFVPYSGEGIGHAYNDCCRIVPSSSNWICVTDADIMLFPSDFAKQFEDVIMRHGNKYDVFTCYTTRVSDNKTCWGGEKSKERDLVKLREMAMTAHAKNYGKVKPLYGPPAGYLLLFRKSLWERFPFPTRGTGNTRVLGIDTAWGFKLLQNGCRIGLMEGVVAVHYYRLHDCDKSAHGKYLEQPR